MSARQTPLSLGWLANTPVPSHLDPRETVSDFEARRSAIQERKQRVSSLNFTINRRNLNIRRHLSHCRPRRRCCCPACPECHREFAIVFASRAAAVLPKSKDLHFVTLVAERWMIPPGKLWKVNLRRVTSTLLTQFKRAGIGDKVAIGRVEATYKSHFDRIVVHAHLVVADVRPRQLRQALGHYYPRFEERIRDTKILNHTRYHGDGHLSVTGTVVKRVKSRIRLLGYLAKIKTWADGKYVDHTGKLRRKGKFRPPKPIHNELLRFLAKHNETAFLIMQKARCSRQGRIWLSVARKGSSGE